MNYRHVFHAGNICDAVKHAVLTLALASLRLKDKNFCILDTHAGTGLYDLADPRALKTGEAQAGIYRLLAAKPVPGLDDYYSILREVNPEWRAEQPNAFRFYPGSPMIARHMLRVNDRLILCEFHEDDYAELKRKFRDDKQTHIHHRDGYEALHAFLPPAEKRGLVFIDPPFEDTNEFTRLGDALIAAHARWPQGIYLAWYPIKERPAVWRFHEKLIASGIPEILCAEFIFEQETRTDRLNGCGFIFINPPWKMKEKMQQVLPELHVALKTNYQGVEIKRLARL